MALKYDYYALVHDFRDLENNNTGKTRNWAAVLFLSNIYWCIHVLTWIQLHYHSPHDFQSIYTRCCQNNLLCSMSLSSSFFHWFSIYDIYKQKPFWVKTQLEVLLFSFECFYDIYTMFSRETRTCSALQVNLQFLLSLSFFCLPPFHFDPLFVFLVRRHPSETIQPSSHDNHPRKRGTTVEQIRRVFGD